MIFKVPANIEIEADTLAEAASLAGPVVEDINYYLGEGYSVEPTSGMPNAAVGEG